MMRFVVVLCFLVGDGLAGFFDLTDIDDPLALLWNTKEEKYQQCSVTLVDGTVIGGVCKPAGQCLLSGGQPNGYCGGLSTCCIYGRSCGRTTRSKVSYFTDNKKLTNVRNCDYTVQLENNNVCQIRLDFITFKLSPPTVLESSFKCVHDVLTISPNNYGIPPLCGNNNNQHVYVHLEDSNEKQISIKIRLADRLTNTEAITDPSWKIKVTQLECAMHKPFFHNYANFIADFNNLAPVGAIQYFTENSGTVRSFGFDSSLGQSAYTRGQRYAIAFKRTTANCGVRFTPNYIKLKSSTVPAYTDSDCVDYIFVPELTFIQPSGTYDFTAKVCLDETLDEFISKPPGPLYIHFVADSVYDPDTDADMLYAFDLRYNLLNDC